MIRCLSYHTRNSLRVFSSNSRPIILTDYINENRNQLQPPVCNKMIYNGQIQLMIVGGPNQRDDFHINDGEEIFYQIKGGMDINIYEKNVFKSIHVPEGHIFILPDNIPHSPQRYPNTVGLVFERKRLKHEYDGLRYYVSPNKSEILHEEYFKCSNLGLQLGPIINRVLSSDGYKNRTPSPNMPVQNPPTVIDDKREVGSSPILFSSYIESFKRLKGLNAYNNQTPMTILNSKEFRVDMIMGEFKNSLSPLNQEGHDLFLWQFSGTSTLSLGDDVTKQHLESGAIHMITDRNTKINIEQAHDGVILCVSNRVFD